MTAPRIHLADTRRADEEPTFSALAGFIGTIVGFLLLACAPAAVTYLACELLHAAELNPLVEYDQ